MKKCPTCDKEFEDSMRFCQVDGTSLVDDAPAFDPYATIVATPFAPIASTEGSPAEEISADNAAESEQESIEVAEIEPVINQTVGSLPIAPPDDVLDLPEADPLKTMYVSDSEMRAAVGGDDTAGEPEIVEIPPIESAYTSEPQIENIPEPEPPSFSVPDVPAPSFGEFAPPASPFSTPEQAHPVFDEPAPRPQFDEAATIIQPSFNSPFDPPPAPVAEWTPPPAPDASWQNQEIGQNTPFQPPPSGTEGQSKGLAIASLVCGILSLLCCNWFVVGIAAIVMGFIARSKAKSDPGQYGGEGLALVGIITGGISLLLGVIVIILYFVGALAGMLGNL